MTQSSSNPNPNHDATVDWRLEPLCVVLDRSNQVLRSLIARLESGETGDDILEECRAEREFGEYVMKAINRKKSEA